MKWFPKFFTVHNHAWLDSKNIGQVDGLKVIEVNLEDSSLTGSLGITDERAEELTKHIEIQFLQCGNIVEVMSNMTNGIVKHPNESFFVAYQIAHKMRARSSNSFVEGFLEHLRKKGNQGGGDN